MKIIKFLCLCLISGWLMAADLADSSIYHIESSWWNQNNTQIEITELQGNVQIVAFIYTYCEHTCPTIIAKIKQIAKALPAEIHDNVKFTLISLDPDRDTPEILKRYMQKQRLDEQQWTMLSGDPDDVLELAALFGVRYKPMGVSDIAHSNMISVLDQQGVIYYQMKGLNQDISVIIAEIKKII